MGQDNQQYGMSRVLITSGVYDKKILLFALSSSMPSLECKHGNVHGNFIYL